MKTGDFTVRGKGWFPYDMLRYDACWPASGDDAELLAGDELEPEREVTLRTDSPTAPTEGRWLSFGWRVT